MPPPSPSAGSTHRLNRGGFSLVLSLVVTSLLLLVIVTLTSFLKVESQLAGHALNRTQSRLQAMVALRLALAHLQQEAGPDRRMTARADITADTMQKGWSWSTIRNPLWTGVWRSDNPSQPPAWLVSGRHDQPAGAQSASLAGFAAYDVGKHLPWDTNYAPDALRLVTLIGNASASPATLPTDTAYGKPDGRIQLPRIALPDRGATGSYAYWIGDEGVKARIDLRDPRVTPAAGAATEEMRQAALRGAGRSGLELIPGLETAPETGLDRRVRSLGDLHILSLTAGSGLTETTPPSVLRRLHTETTFWSRGVNCDTRLGGLKVDLSLAFEMPETAWLASEFSGGKAATDSAGQPLSGANYFLGADANTAVFNFDKVNVPYDAADHRLSPVYTIDWGVNGYKSRGPTWDALRNYYLLYKEIDWSTPTNPSLRARTHFPNTISLAASGYGGTAHYSHRYNRMNTSENFTVLDVFNGKEAPRPVKVAVTPYVARQLMVWGLMEEKGELRLTLSPLTVLHNPYNVAVRLEKEADSQESAAMRLSFRYWDKWSVVFSTSSKGSWPRKVIDLARATDATTNQAESFRTYIKDGTVLAPGEFRVFSSSSAGPQAFTRLPPPATNSFDFLGGFYLPWLDAKGARVARLPTDSISVQVLSTGPFYVRHLLTCWRGDRIMDTGNSGDGQLYNVCSEVTELLANDLDRSGSVPAKVFPAGYRLPQAGSPPTIIAVFDYGIRWPRDPQPFPVFSHSNPMATMTRPEATGIGPNAMPSGFAKTSSSFKLTVRSPGSWPEVLEVAGAGDRTYGAMSVNSAKGGLTKAVYTEVPLSPPLSLAQFSHANFTIRDQEPLLAIGNSLGSLYSPNNFPGVFLIDGNLITWDQTWWINAALFDHYFLSGAAPEGIRGKTFATRRPLDAVLDDFVAGKGGLANPRTSLTRGRDPATLRAMVGDHRRIAGATLTEGAFNVNSTSVEAWTSILTGAKRLSMGSVAATMPAPNRNTRYPRAVRADGPGFNDSSGFDKEEAWSGLATFSDAQIRLLAKSIVDEIRHRTKLAHRDYLAVYAGGTPANQHTASTAFPFRFLSEFVNRSTCGYQPAASMAGCLQAAIVRADTDGANLSNRTPPNAAPQSSPTLLAPNLAPGSVPWTMPVDFGREHMSLFDPRNPGVEVGHLAVGSPASLTQADILAVIGPALATRSDTFVIRCYGDVATAPGALGAKAATWIEAVVQRSPEFCDDSQPPETEVSDVGNADLPNPNLKMVNRLLGRRFQVISIRFLSPKEL
jgi:hypothetical protein